MRSLVFFFSALLLSAHGVSLRQQGFKDGTGTIAAKWFVTSSGSSEAQATSSSSSGQNPIAVFDTSLGQMRVELFVDKAPVTASNFIDLAKKGFYDGQHFHRVIPNFMDQCGDPISKDPNDPMAGTGGPEPKSEFLVLGKGAYAGKTIRRNAGGNIPDEFGPEKISNDIGMISMANTGRADTGGSQFFINVHHNDFLDWFANTKSSHPVFAKVIDGYDVAVKISKVSRNGNAKPNTPVKMNKVTIEEGQ